MYINFYLFQIPYNITHVSIIYDVDKCKAIAKFIFIDMYYSA